MPTPRETRADRIRAVSRAASRPVRWDGPSAIAARMSARLLIDFDPGTVIRPVTGPSARGAAQPCSVLIPLLRLVVSESEPRAWALLSLSVSAEVELGLLELRGLPGVVGQLLRLALGRLGAALGLALGCLSAAPGLAFRGLGTVRGAPGDTRLALGVDRREQQAAEQAEVLQELDPLGVPDRLVLLQPERVTRDRGRH